jgi:hypothetical protein
MASINETVASLAGKELGDSLFTSLTGNVIDRTPPTDTSSDHHDDFNFRSEMRQTRLETEKYLSQGKIQDAEQYMEDRRQLFLTHGYLIRKLNQAYFAFHGTYAASAASISPIGDQVQQLRDHSESLATFLRTVSAFNTYQELMDHLESFPEIPQPNGE